MLSFIKDFVFKAKDMAFKANAKDLQEKWGQGQGQEPGVKDEDLENLGLWPKKLQAETKEIQKLLPQWQLLASRVSIMSKANVQHHFSFVLKLSVIINRIYSSPRCYGQGIYLTAKTKAGLGTKDTAKDKDTALCPRNTSRMRTSHRGHITDDGAEQCTVKMHHINYCCHSKHCYTAAASCQRLASNIKSSESTRLSWKLIHSMGLPLLLQYY